MISLPLALHALLLQQPPIKDTCSLQINTLSYASKPLLFSNLSTGVDFSDPSVAGLLSSESGSGDPRNSPVAGAPSRVADRSQRAGGRAIRLNQPQVARAATQTNTCPSPAVLSCSAIADATDACCVQRPGGVLVHTQFWDTDEGVQDSWGVHGLYLTFLPHG